MKHQNLLWINELCQAQPVRHETVQSSHARWKMLKTTHPYYGMYTHNFGCTVPARQFTRLKTVFQGFTQTELPEHPQRLLYCGLLSKYAQRKYCVVFRNQHICSIVRTWCKKTLNPVFGAMENTVHKLTFSSSWRERAYFWEVYLMKTHTHTLFIFHVKSMRYAGFFGIVHQLDTVLPRGSAEILPRGCLAHSY